MFTVKDSKHSKNVSKYINALKKDIIKYKDLYIMLLPVMLTFFVFHYIPIYGIQIAFRKFNAVDGIWGSPWVGLKYFKEFVNILDFWLIIRNTLLISLYLIIFGFPAPIVFALILNEIKEGPFKKVTQTISYLPHFISTVVVVGLIMQILSPSGGLVNNFLALFGKESIYFVGEKKYFRTIYVLMELWRGTGFGAIVYIAAITSIDSEIYESAIIDGAGRLKRMWYITIPSIIPTITILFILRMGGILSIGWTEVLLLQNPINREVSEIISTYLYKRGLEQAEYSFGAAAGLLNSIVSLIFVIVTNFLAKKTSETSLF